MKKIWITATCVFFCDGITKWVCQKYLHSIVKIGNLLHLSLVKNTGIALGFFADSKLITLILPPVIIVLLVGFFHKQHMNDFTHLACGMILGGFIGNYLERLLFGYVTDMLFFPWLPWFICNLADIAICLGALLLFIKLLKPVSAKD